MYYTIYNILYIYYRVYIVYINIKYNYVYKLLICSIMYRVYIILLSSTFLSYCVGYSRHCVGLIAMHSNIHLDKQAEVV